MLPTWRLLSSLLAFVLLLSLSAPANGAAAVQAKPPVLTKLVKSSGPLSPTRVVLQGRHLGGASKVTFGSRSGTGLTQISANKISVLTPRGAKAGDVAVRVRTKAGWSAATKNARYTFVKAPALRALSPTAGRFGGGVTVTLTGKELGRTTQVTFGGVAAKIRSRSDQAITVTAPPGVPGRAAVKVQTPGGTGAGQTFTYVVPQAGSSSTADLVDGAVQATGVEWVTGGNPVSGPAVGQVDPWVVGLGAGVTPPAVGTPYVVPTSTAVFPSGLAGTVESVAAQGDGRTRVTVAPDDLTKVFDEFVQDFSGTVGDAEPAARRRDAETSRGVKFALRGPSPFDCDNEEGADDEAESASLGLNLTFGLENIQIDHHFDAGNAFRRPKVDFAITADVVTSATIEAEAAMTCELRHDWVNINRKGFFTPIPSLTVSFGAAVDISLAAGGTYKYEDRTRVTMAAQATPGSTPT